MKNSLQILSAFAVGASLSSVAWAQPDDDSPFGTLESAPPQVSPPEAAAPTAPPPAAAPTTQSPPPPAGPPSWQGPATPPNNSYSNLSAQPEAEAENLDADISSRRPKRSGVVFIPRIGTLLSGHANATNDNDCSSNFTLAASQFDREAVASLCLPLFSDVGFADVADETASLEDKSSMLIAADLLYHATPAVRIGGSALWNLSSEVADSQASEPISLGSEVSLDFTFEHLFAEDAKGQALLYRLMAGPTVLFPGGNLSALAEREKEICRGALKVCEIDNGPFPGYNLGAGLGTLLPVGPGSLRADLLLNYVSLPFRKVDATIEDGASTRSAKAKEEASFVRLWLMMGSEI